MTPVEDPASVTIQTSITKDSTETEFVANNTSMSGSNAAVENVHNQSNAADEEANDRESNING